MAQVKQNNTAFRAIADASDNRLAFVSFALLILVIGPFITGALINLNERELLEAVESAQSQVQTVRGVVQEQRVGASYPRLAAQQRQLDTALATAAAQQNRARQRISNLHDIQDAVIAAFGLLGLIAAFYSSRALHHTRENQKQLRELAAANSRRVRALESLFETAGQLSVNASPQEMHGHMTGRVAHVLQVDKATLWRYDDTRQALTPLLPAFGFLDEHLRAIEVEVAEGEWAHDLLFHDATIRSNNVPQERDGALYKQLRDWNIVSVLAVPLIAHGQPIGIFCAYDKQENAHFTDEDEQVLRTFAGQAAFALHSAHQYARAHSRSEQLATLARLTQVINSSLELETIVPAFLQEARSLVPHARARLALYPVAIDSESWSQEYPDADETETDLLRRLRGKTRREAQSGPPSSSFTAASPNVPDGQGVGSPNVEGVKTAPEPVPLVQVWTLEPFAPVPTRMPAQMAQLERYDPLMLAMQTGTLQGGRTIAVPLIVQQNVLGALEFTAGNGEAYGENALQLAQQAAGQLAAATQNARLYEEATHRAEQLEWSMEETHHRIKNNLQAVLAILDLYMMETEEASGAAKNALEGNFSARNASAEVAAQGNAPHALATESALRSAAAAREGLAHAMREVRTIAAVHDLLSQDIRNSRVNARHMLDRLVPLLLTASVTAGKRVHTDVQAENVILPSKMASALALAANELIVNAVRHGGHKRTDIALRIELQRLPGQLRLAVTDDGKGFPPNFTLRSQAKIGLSLALTLIERDFGGKLAYVNNPQGGATVTATVPYQG